MSQYPLVRARQIVRRLQTPLRFGTFVIAVRTYCRVVVRLEDGRAGAAVSLDRGLPVHDLVNHLGSTPYARSLADGARAAWEQTFASNPTIWSSGGGLRGLSLMDLAGRQALGELPDPVCPAPPQWVVLGYPPSAGSALIAEETRLAVAAGAYGVKLPVSDTDRHTRERVAAALSVAGPGRVALDLAWSQTDPDSAARLVDGLELGWVEDPFQHGRVRALASLRQLLDVPLASGDEETHLHHPAHLVEADAVDIIRMDATCMGGISAVERYAESSPGLLPVSWHMNPYWNSRAAAVMPGPTISIESSAIGSGVDPLNETRAREDSLRYPPEVEAESGELEANHG